MKRLVIISLAAAAAMIIGEAAFPCLSQAQAPLRYSCSNQLFNALEKEKLEAFTKTTGVKVDVFTSSSASAIYRMMNGYSDIAGTARGLYRLHQDSGYTQVPICKDPLAVITKKACGVESITTTQLTDIFSGKVENWKALGGADMPIVVIVPGTDTAANKNFRRQVMKHEEIDYDFMAYDSTMVIEAVKHFPCGAISFISQGAASYHPSIQTMKIDGYAPTDDDYPYYQTFYYAMKGKPAGTLKQFIEFAFSDIGANIIRSNGMLPVSR